MSLHRKSTARVGRGTIAHAMLFKECRRRWTASAGSSVGDSGAESSFFGWRLHQTPRCAPRSVAKPRCDGGRNRRWHGFMEKAQLCRRPDALLTRSYGSESKNTMNVVFSFLRQTPGKMCTRGDAVALPRSTQGDAVALPLTAVLGTGLRTSDSPPL